MIVVLELPFILMILHDQCLAYQEYLAINMTLVCLCNNLAVKLRFKYLCWFTGASADNDLEKFIRTWGERIPLSILRSVKREADGSFYEDEHIAGSTNLAKLVKAVLDVEQQTGNEIIIRPDSWTSNAG